jgi:hypothetical protein
MSQPGRPGSVMELVDAVLAPEFGDPCALLDLAGPQQAREPTPVQAIAREPLVRSALQASAAEDEDPMVRWASRYALRLDLDRDPGRVALARWPLDGGSVVVMPRLPPLRSQAGASLALLGPGQTG